MAKSDEPLLESISNLNIEKSDMVLQGRIEHNEHVICCGICRVGVLDYSVFLLDLEELTGTPRDHLEFTLWYLGQKRYIQSVEGSLRTM